MVKLIYSIAVVVLVAGCLPRPVSVSVKKTLSNKYDSKGTGLKNKLNIEGYFQFWRTDMVAYSPETKTQDSSFFFLLFYEDGSFLFSSFLKSEMSKRPETFFNEVIQKGKEHPFYFTANWGIYRLMGDSIIAECLENATRSLNHPWNPGEYRFRIVDRNTLQLINSRNFNDQSAETRQETEKFLRSASLITFIPSQIPPSYTWIKKDKFFWRNEDDWKEYMKSY